MLRAVMIGGVHHAALHGGANAGRPVPPSPTQELIPTLTRLGSERLEAPSRRGFDLLDYGRVATSVAARLPEELWAAFSRVFSIRNSDRGA